MRGAPTPKETVNASWSRSARSRGHRPPSRMAAMRHLGGLRMCACCHPTVPRPTRGGADRGHTGQQGPKIIDKTVGPQSRNSYPKNRARVGGTQCYTNIYPYIPATPRALARHTRAPTPLAACASAESAAPAADVRRVVSLLMSKNRPIARVKRWSRPSVVARSRAMHRGAGRVLRRAGPTPGRSLLHTLVVARAVLKLPRS